MYVLLRTMGVGELGDFSLFDEAAGAVQTYALSAQEILQEEVCILSSTLESNQLATLRAPPQH